MKSLRSLGGALLFASGVALIALSVPAGAQTSVSVATLTSLSSFEQSITSGNALPAITNLPPSVLASITGGALDLRVQTNYNASANLLTLTFFTVQTGSPTPTNLGTVNPANIYGSFTIGVDKTYATSSAVMFVGTVSAGANTPVGSIQGAPASLSFAYSSDTPPKITNAAILVAGTGVLFSPTATGTVSITKPPSGGGGGTSGVTIVIHAGSGSIGNGTNSFQVVSNQVLLDASQSTSVNPGALTYAWSTTSPNANIINGNTATPLVQLGIKQQTYQFTVTITDAKGVSATATVTIQYL